MEEGLGKGEHGSVDGFLELRGRMSVAIRGTEEGRSRGKRWLLWWDADDERGALIRGWLA